MISNVFLIMLLIIQIILLTILIMLLTIFATSDMFLRMSEAVFFVG